MAIGDSIQRHPLLRLLVSYIGGIVLADVLYPCSLSLVWVGACGAVALLAVMAVVLLLKRQNSQTVYGLAVSGLFLFIGMVNYALVREGMDYPWSDKPQLYEARVLDEARARERSTQCVVELTAVRDSAAWQRVGRKVLVYMEPCAEADSLMAGDIVCFHGRVQPPRNFSDSLAFDYARYVTMQGLSGTVYLPRTRWSKVGEGSLSLRERMLRLRARVGREYMSRTFEDDVLGVLSALILGDKRGLTKELRVVYSDAGVAHVLALSGMHVGIIYGILAFLLRGLIRRRRLRWLPEVIIIAVLWAFALMVGMSASVVRAVAMCTLYAVARRASGGDSSSPHLLSLTALVMLLVRPLYLFDVGFQLSFMAMVAILWLEPHLEALFQKHRLHPVLAYLVGIVCMSLAAQLGTFPLVLYHFGSFPTYFLVTNLVVVPALFVVVLLMLVWWVLTLAHLPLAQQLGTLLQGFVEMLNRGLTHISHWPGAVVHVEGYTALAALFTYLFILFAGLFILKKWPRGAVLALASLLGLFLSFLF